MYINTDLLLSRELTFEHLIFLQLAKQNKTEDMGEHLVPRMSLLPELTDRGFTTLVKAKNKTQSTFKRVRLTKEGNSLLADLETVGVNDEDLIVFEWCKKVYKEKGKQLGNQKRTKSYIAQFRAQSGIDRNKLAHLVGVFVNDESRMEYSHMLEYVFFKGHNAFQTRFELDQSALWKYYQNNLEYFTRRFKEMDEAAEVVEVDKCPNCGSEAVGEADGRGECFDCNTNWSL